MKRRGFLAAGGALVVAFSTRAGPNDPKQAGEHPGAGPLPGSLKAQPLLDGWIAVAADGSVTVFTGKAELGQGIKTALIQLAADELVLSPDRITLVTADTERTANEGYTAGSHSMQDSGTAIRHAAAQVRELLVAAAAQRLAVPAAQLVPDNGVLRAGGRSVGYGELVAGKVLHVDAAPQSRLRDAAQRRWIGKPARRVDIPVKVCGGAPAYVQDMRLPGMVHGRVLRPPGRLSAPSAFDSGAAERATGVLKVVRDGRFIGLLAQREWQAVQALKLLAAGTQWADAAQQPDAVQPGRFGAVLRQAPAQDFVILDRAAPASAAANNAAVGKTFSASYTKPYLMHASIGPSCAIAQWQDGKFTVWTHTQGVFPLRKALAELLRVPQQQVHCIHVEGSGCYGHNAADDVAADAVLLARALPGRPVRVQWMRGDEHAWEPLGPPMLATLEATLDAAGGIARWQHEVWSNTHSSRPGAAGDLLAATHLAAPFAPSPPVPLPQPEGGGDRNAVPLYALPTARVVHHFLPQMPVRVSALRSLGAYLNVFAIESFLDELARAAGADPVAFRQRHMQDARALEVMRVAAAQFGWAAFRRQPGRGRGFAFARYKNLGAYAAVAMEVEVWRGNGALRVLRAVAAVDSGEAVNPDGIRNQIEGGIVQSASWTTTEEVAFDGMRVASRDWGGYPILRFAHVPERIDVHVVDRPGQPFLGTGEAAQGPAAAAIANAVADATGVRVRDLPLSQARLRAAFGV